ncbi:MAG TPA: hypothetical protein VNR18_05030, partial [Hyphomicrobiales bacterium]|nr:hypothetical protein [Hyphomicrobiales bacterium]
TNLTNNGLVNGGTLAGTVQNNGTVQNVTLADTAVRGGVLKGNVQGKGTITDALVDVTALSPDVTLGAGTRITADTAHNVPGLDLSEAIRGSDGTLDADQPLLVTEAGENLSLRELARQGVDAAFASGGTQVEDGNGILALSTNELPETVVPVVIGAVSTTDEPDGVRLAENGDLLVTRGGVQTRFVPAPLDTEALEAGLQDIGADATEAGGALLVQVGDTTFSLRLALFANPAPEQEASALLEGYGIQALQGDGAWFTTVGSPSNPVSYRILVNYPDGSSQEVLPYLHDVQGFGRWIEDLEWSFKASSVNGQLQVWDSEGRLLGRGIPAYQVSEAEKVDEPSLKLGEDVNGDGLRDWVFRSGTRSQVIYNLGL